MRMIDKGDKGFSRVHWNFHGVQQFCSGALLHGLSGYLAWCAPPVGRDALSMFDFNTPVKRLDEYMNKYAYKNSVFLMPAEIAYACVLEGIYDKAAYGEGNGNQRNMYASDAYATGTWFIADRKRKDSSFSCLNFMKHVQQLGVQKVGRIHISPWRPGAHGGECKGAVYAPNLPALREYIDDCITRVNQHIQFIAHHYNVPDVMPVEDIDPADEVAAQW